MPDEDFALIESALRAVDKYAARLSGGDAEGHVRRSMDELRAAFTARTEIEPAVDRLLQSLRILNTAHLAGNRRDFRRDSSHVDRLLAAVQIELLPALRRVGFRV